MATPQNKELGILNTPSCEKKSVSRESSILEDELNQLRSEVYKINELSTIIYHKLGSPKPCASNCDKESVGTVSGYLREIRAVAEEARQEFEGIAKLLESQLGDLRLEY